MAQVWRSPAAIGRNACPAVTAVGTSPANIVRTKPLLVTDASARLSLIQVTLRPEIAMPAESRATAVSCTLSPATSVSAAGPTVSVATGTGGGSTTSDSWHATAAAASATARVD